MKVDKLKVGEIYRCNLSGCKILIIMTGDQKDKDGDVIKESIKAGKFALKDLDGSFKYMFTDLHDGQLTEIKS